MSDEVAKQFETQKPQEIPAEQGRSVTLSITLHPNNQIDFQMPMGNKILAYGLLECARAKLDEMYLMQTAKQAQTSRGGVNGLLKRMNGG